MGRHIRACLKTIRSYRNPRGLLQLFLRLGTSSDMAQTKITVAIDLSFIRSFCGLNRLVQTKNQLSLTRLKLNPKLSFQHSVLKIPRQGGSQFLRCKSFTNPQERVTHPYGNFTNRLSSDFHSPIRNRECSFYPCNPLSSEVNF